MSRQLAYLSGAPRVSTMPDSESGGPRSHVLGVIGAFRELGWNVHPFIVGDRVPSFWTSSGSGHTFQRNEMRRLLADLVRMFLSRWNAKQALRVIGSEVDLVYERFGIFQSLGRSFKRRGVAWVLETNGPLFHEAREDRKSIALVSIARRSELQAYQDCDVLVSVTMALKELLVEEAGISPEKILVVPNGVDTARFDPAKHEGRRMFPGVVVGYVGSLIGWQRLDMLIDVVSSLRSEGLQISLMIVGDGPERPAWEEKARAVGVATNVKFVGGVPADEVPLYIAGFDLGYSGQVPLKVGRMYHSPLKLYEYMSMAKPVIASRFEDATRVVRDEETGFLFEPGNEVDLRRALRRAYDAQSRLAEMGAKARASIVAEHSWVARVRHLLAGVEEVLAQRRQTGATTRA